MCLATFSCVAVLRSPVWSGLHGMAWPVVLWRPRCGAGSCKALPLVTAGALLLDAPHLALRSDCLGILLAALGGRHDKLAVMGMECYLAEERGMEHYQATPG